MGNQQETVRGDFMELSKLPKEKYLKYYIAGFADAEGCFNISLKKQETTRFGWVLDPVFHITQHKNGVEVLKIIEMTLHCGRVIPKPGQEDTLQFLVDNRRQIMEKIIPFFDEYELVVKKNDFGLFKRIVEGLENKEHAKPEPFKELIKLAFQMNMNGKQRRYKLEEVLNSIKGSSETTRETNLS